jgi:hypothetical protein
VVILVFSIWLVSTEDGGRMSAILRLWLSDTRRRMPNCYKNIPILQSIVADLAATISRSTARAQSAYR